LVAFYRQYFLAKHAFVCLELEKSLKKQENSMSYVQYANELWSSTVFLSDLIVSKSREACFGLTSKQTKSSLVSNTSVNSNIISDAIAAIYLLQNTNTKELFNEFLKNRTVKII
jgi:hypothetical protein